MNNKYVFFIICVLFNFTSPINLINTELLKENISNVELVEHLCNTQVGVGFVNRHMGLPQNTFVSNDAITWLMNNLKTLNNRDEAVQRLQVNTKVI